MAKKQTAKPLDGKSLTNEVEVKAEWKVENVVATVVLDLGTSGNKIDLNQIARKYSDC